MLWMWGEIVWTVYPTYYLPGPSLKWVGEDISIRTIKEVLFWKRCEKLDILNPCLLKDTMYGAWLWVSQTHNFILRHPHLKTLFPHTWTASQPLMLLYIWQLTSTIYKVKANILYLTSCIWYLTSDIWHLTYEILHLTPNIWHLTYNT